MHANKKSISKKKKLIKKLTNESGPSRGKPWAILRPITNAPTPEIQTTRSEIFRKNLKSVHQAKKSQVVKFDPSLSVLPKTRMQFF